MVTHLHDERGMQIRRLALARAQLRPQLERLAFETIDFAVLVVDGLSQQIGHFLLELLL